MSGKRIVAFIIDLFVVGSLSSIIITICAILITDANMMLTYAKFIMFATSLVLVMKDAWHCSVGKRLLKLQIVDLKGQKADWRACVVRNLFLVLWAIEGIVLLATGRRLGDYVAKTNVVQVQK